MSEPIEEETGKTVSDQARELVAEMKRKAAEARAHWVAKRPDRLEGIDVFLVRHWDSGEDDAMRGIYPGTPEGMAQAEALEASDNAIPEACPRGLDTRLCRGSFIEEVNYGEYKG